MIETIIRDIAEQGEAEIRRLKRERRQAYWERNQLVCALSKLIPSHLARHPDKDKKWDDDWRWIVVMFVNQKQLTWHIHDSELSMFDHLKRDVKFTWDGHKTVEKYNRLTTLKVRKVF